MARLTCGSLFAGIGGFDLGFERAGYDIRWQVEIDPWARAVLAKHWPHVHRHDDIRTAGAHNLEAVDVLCGGFPCQDISLAGKGAGMGEGTRSGLWSEYARIIRELRPRYVVVENVAALLARGLGRVVGDLAACGYDAEWDCIPAAAVGAPHRRDRLWLVAYTNGGRFEASHSGEWPVSIVDACSDVPDTNDAARWWRAQQGAGGHGRSGVDGTPCDVADTNSGRRVRVWQQEPTGQQGARGHVAYGCGTGRASTTPHDADGVGIRLQGLIFAGAAARPTYRSSLRRRTGWWENEPNVGRVAHGVPARVDRLRGLGNAIVPQIAEWIAHRITEAEARRVAA
jgi:DNA (cytosine-5)-methyltransferase 1